MTEHTEIKEKLTDGELKGYCLFVKWEPNCHEWHAHVYQECISEADHEKFVYYSMGFYASEDRDEAALWAKRKACARLYSKYSIYDPETGRRFVDRSPIAPRNAAIAHFPTDRGK